MGGGPVIPEGLVRGVSVMLYIIGSMFALFIIGVWSFVILKLVQGTKWPLESTLAIISVTVALLCAIIWFGNRLGVILLADTTEKGIWRVLIAALLASFASAVLVSLPSTKHNNLSLQAPSASSKTR